MLSATGVGVAALLAGLIAGQWAPTALAKPIQWLWWLGAAALAAAICSMAVAVMPRIGHSGDPLTVTYFGHVNRVKDRGTLLEHLVTASAAPLARAVDQLRVLSRTVHVKYRCTQVAILLLGVTATTMLAAVFINHLIS